jgi:membrane-anchored glycerophosphoryl diester phosphodiesterase (GDPDase)
MDTLDIVLITMLVLGLAQYLFKERFENFLKSTESFFWRMAKIFIGVTLIFIIFYFFLIW